MGSAKDGMPDVEQLQKRVAEGLKKIDQFQKKVEGQMHLIDAKEKKQIKIKGKLASVSINSLGIVFLEFIEKGEGQKFYNSLK